MASDFPTKENPKLCKNGCGNKIYLSNETGKYLPYNLDDTQHDCRPKEEQKQNHKEITLEQVRKKLESIGIVLDVEKLMNQK